MILRSACPTVIPALNPLSDRVALKSLSRCGSGSGDRGLLHCTDLGEVVVDGEAAADDAEDGDEEAGQEDDA